VGRPLTWSGIVFGIAIPSSRVAPSGLADAAGRTAYRGASLHPVGAAMQRSGRDPEDPAASAAKQRRMFAVSLRKENASHVQSGFHPDPARGGPARHRRYQGPGWLCNSVFSTATGLQHPTSSSCSRLRRRGIRRHTAAPRPPSSFMAPQRFPWTAEAYRNYDHGSYPDVFPPHLDGLIAVDPDLEQGNAASS
jgi:hypothetical protein